MARERYCPPLQGNTSKKQIDLIGMWTQMHYIKMIMTPTTFLDEPQEEIHELLWNYLSALYRNWQIYRGYELVKTDIAL